MDLTLTRTEKVGDGIWGILTDPQGRTVAFTLEHAYPSGDKFEPKLPPGTYTCKRGPHRLHNMIHDFETFEIEGVPGHSNILFHPGNYNRDSEGCVLVGGGRINEMLIQSRDVFAKFLTLQTGLDTFQLTVVG